MPLAVPPAVAELSLRLRAAALRLLLAEQGRFALWLPVAAITGDACYFGLHREPATWLGLAVLICGAALTRLRARLTVYAAGLLLAAFGFGFAAAQLASLRVPPFAALPSHAAQIAGHIDAAEPLPDGMRLTLNGITVDGGPILHRRLRVRVPDNPAAAPGAMVSVRAMIAPPSPPAYPGGRDLQRDAWFDGMAGFGYALGAVTIVHPAPPDHLAALRSRIATRIAAELPAPEGAVAATLLTGLSAAIPDADRAAFRDAGLSHLLAIAGLHIAIVMGLVLLVTRLALLRSERAALFWPVRAIGSLAALAAGLAYLLLTGAHVPTLRSFTMAVLVCLALLTGRRAVSLRGWGLAVLAVIAIAPEQITGASFQLSFAAVLALIAGYAALRAPLHRLRGDSSRARVIAHHAATLMLTSLLAGAASMPFIAYHFGTIQLYFVLANLIAVPLTAFWVMPAGLVALLLMPLGLDRLALIPMGWGIQALLSLAHTLAAWPGATVAVPHMPMHALLPIALGLAWLCLWRSRIRWLGIAPMLAGCLATWLVVPPTILLDSSARLAGLRGPRTLYVRQTQGGDAFVQAAWQQYLGLPVQDITTAPATNCDAAGCRSLAAAIPVRFAAAQPVCDATVIVAQTASTPSCPGALAIGRGALRRNGAAAIWLSPRPVMITDRDDRGQRPWVFLAQEQAKASLANLPMAPTELLPP
jgi:competence protein ComEC